MRHTHMRDRQGGKDKIETGREAERERERVE